MKSKYTDRILKVEKFQIGRCEVNDEQETSEKLIHF